MRYTLVQGEIDPPTFDQVRAVLLNTMDLNLPVVPADASGIVKDSYGILIQRLDADQARGLQAAFDRVGYATQVVEQDQLFDLPAPRGCTQLDPTDEALILYDLYGNGQIVQWDNVLIVASGVIGKVRTVSHEEVVSGAGDGVPLTLIRLEEVRSFETTLELILNDEPMRVRIDPHRFNYGYLGNAKANRAEDNFLRMVSDIAARARHAVINRGAKSVIAEGPSVGVYPMRKNFEEELTWLVWRAMQV
jgi:hypothetical protein